MKTNAAVLWGLNEPWSVEEVDLDGPKEGEVLISFEATGLCHSDHHVVTGDLAGVTAADDRRARGRGHRAGGRARCA